MRNAKNAVPPAGKGNVRTINGVEQTIGYPAGWEDGTAVNRDFLMAIQGFDDISTVFNADGSITESFGDGSTKTTVFNADGTITETFSGGGQTLSKTTTFLASGNINEVISG